MGFGSGVAPQDRPRPPLGHQDPVGPGRGRLRSPGRPDRRRVPQARNLGAVGVRGEEARRRGWGGILGIAIALGGNVVDRLAVWFLRSKARGRSSWILAPFLLAGLPLACIVAWLGGDLPDGILLALLLIAAFAPAIATVVVLGFIEKRGQGLLHLLSEEDQEAYLQKTKVQGTLFQANKGTPGKPDPESSSQILDDEQPQASAIGKSTNPTLEELKAKRMRRKGKLVRRGDARQDSGTKVQSGTSGEDSDEIVFTGKTDYDEERAHQERTILVKQLNRVPPALKALFLTVGPICILVGLSGLYSGHKCITVVLLVVGSIMIAVCFSKGDPDGESVRSMQRMKWAEAALSLLHSQLEQTEIAHRDLVVRVGFQSAGYKPDRVFGDEEFGTLLGCLFGQARIEVVRTTPGTVGGTLSLCLYRNDGMVVGTVPLADVGDAYGGRGLTVQDFVADNIPVEGPDLAIRVGIEFQPHC